MQASASEVVALPQRSQFVFISSNGPDFPGLNVLHCNQNRTRLAG
jgi:hypothetical protein